MSNIEINDPLYSDQWHFNLLGDIETIWEEFTGVGVNVGVFDDGVESDHEDLDDNYDASLEMVLVDSDPNSANDGHGTSVAGLIAAENNGLGGVGVAWGATVTGVDFLNDAYLDGYNYQAIDHMSEFDVVNQSYGYTPDFYDQLSLSEINSFGQLDAIAGFNAASAGRDGLGTIMVKAVGNSANDSFLQSYGINGNAQGDSGNNVHFIVAVGALSENGFVTSYSNYGANLLVSAGAGSVTTDLPGSGGYDSSDYTDSFGGTSAATPVTAGVVALMLEANPDLTLPEVQMILAVSAAMTGSEFGEAGEGYEVAEWVSIGDGTWNGGGMTYNPSYGYGAVDAFAAVRMAEIWSLFSDGRTLDTQSDVTVTDSGTYEINDLEYTDIVFDVTEGVIIDHLYVALDISHSWASDLTIQIITPDGDVIDLLMDDGGSAEIDYSWTFGVAALRGIDSTGEWTVRLYDDETGFDGSVTDVSLSFVGAEDTGDDTWNFTDDFLDLAAVEGDRLFIGDDGDDGGTNTINLAAVTGNVVATLGENETIRVDGVNWATQETDAINAIATGDGDDRINGSSNDDVIFTGRGNDQVAGDSGGDQIFAHQGDDVVFGDSNGGYGTEGSAQIYRLFNSVFGREPGKDGHQNWLNQMLTGNMSLNDIAELFIVSPEFVLTYGTSTNVEFVTLLFQNVLGRDPAQSGLDAWVANIENGMTRAEVVQNISEGGENIINTRDGLADFEENSDATIYAPRVYRLFEAIFGREPNENGFGAWLDNFDNGMTFTEAVENFMGTTEFSVLYAGTDDSGFIETLFMNVLGRAPADSGLAAWVQNLENGMTRAEVVEFFVDSAEFIIRTTDDMIDFMNNLGNGDQIDAGAGANVVAGGAYADEFIFSSDSASDTIVLDLEQWDALTFDTGFGFTSASDVVAEMYQDGDDVVFEANGVSVTFMDTELAAILEDQINYSESLLV